MLTKEKIHEFLDTIEQLERADENNDGNGELDDARLYARVVNINRSIIVRSTTDFHGLDCRSVDVKCRSFGFCNGYGGVEV